MDSAGNVYIADTLNNRIRKVSNGVIITIAGNGTAGFSGDNGPAINASLFTPIGVAVDSVGNLYIADVNNSRVRKVANGVITTVPGTAGFTPFGIAIDSTGSLYIAAAQHNRIIKVSNGVASTLAGTGIFGSSGDGGPAIAAQVGAPTSVAVDSAGNVYFADAGATGNDYLPSSGAVRKVSNGVITTVARGNAVTVDDAGSVYVGDETLNLIRKISRGVITAMPVSPALSFRSWQIAVDSAGHVYCEDALRSGILVLTATGAATLSSVSVDGMTNGASNRPIPIAPGEIVTLSGSGLGPSQLTAARPRSDGFYDTQLAGTSVQFNGFPAPVLYTSARQVGVVVPYAVTGASAQITVTYQGQSAPPPAVAIASSALALFTADSSGKGQAAAVNQDGSINGPSTPAPIGSVISLYATGEGETSPQGIDGKLATAPFPTPNFPIDVTFGGEDAPVLSGEVQYVGGAPGQVAGLLQINVRIPAGLMPGKPVPVFISNGTRQSQAGVTIAVSRN